MLLKWRSSKYLHKFGDIQNVKVHNLKHSFMLYGIMTIFGNEKNNPTMFLEQGIYDKMFPFQKKLHDGENSPQKKFIEPHS
jgi:hypothetical protein